MTEPDSGKPLNFRALLGLRNFRFLWLGQIVSNFGDSMTNLALLLLINHLTGSTAALASMAILLALPSLTFGLFAGVIVDRADRKRIMLLSDLLRSIFVLGFILVDGPERIWLLYGIGFVQASIGSFFTPARGALLPNLVPKEGLLVANSVAQTSRIIFGLLGTGFGGWVIGNYESYRLVFVLDALTFLLSMAFISRIKYEQPASENKGPIQVKRIFRELGEGLKLTFSNRVLSASVLAFAVTMLGLGAVNILLIPVLIDELKVAETWFAYIELSQTIGMVLAGVLVAGLATRLRTTSMLSVSLVLLGITVACMSLPTAAWHIMIILFFAGLFVTPIQAAGSTIMQTAVPNDMRGRTGAANNAFITSAQLISMGCAGLLADTLGTRPVFVLGGALVSLAGIFAMLMFRGVTLEAANITRVENDEAEPESTSTQA